MPYITSERVKEIRTQVKKEFPGFKFSIRRHHGSTVILEILQAPFNMLSNPENQNECVNTFYISENYRENPAVREVLEKLYAIMNEGNGTLVEDGDYGTVPRFYTNLRIGSYDKPFEVVPVTQETTLQATNAAPKEQSTEEGIQLIQYSEKALVIAGNTYPLRDKLRELGGKFNRFLKDSNGNKFAGWVFRAIDRETVEAKLNLK